MTMTNVFSLFKLFQEKLIVRKSYLERMTGLLFEGAMLPSSGLFCYYVSLPFIARE